MIRTNTFSHRFGRLLRETLLLLVLSGVALGSFSVFASEVSEDIYALSRVQISKSYPGSKIEIEKDSLSCPTLPESVNSARLEEDSGKGIAILTLQGSDTQKCSLRFRAMSPAWYSQKRVTPGEKLDPTRFDLRDVDVSQGMAHEMRGLFLEKGALLKNMEAKQTLVENQIVLSSAVQKTPDMKRGDFVQIQMRSGAVTLSTPGMAEEPGYVGASVRVMSQKTKRSLEGKLISSGIVEVLL